MHGKIYNSIMQKSKLIVNIATTIRNARLAKGWTQDELAAKSGLNRVRITELENGRIKNPTIATLLAVANALKIGISEFFQKS